MDALLKSSMTVKRTTRPIKPSRLHPGARSDASGKAVNNVILLSLPDEEYSLLRPHLEPVELPQYEVLHEPGEKITFAYFLNHGMTALVALSRDGRSVEVGLAGKDGSGVKSLTVGLGLRILCALNHMAG